MSTKKPATVAPTAKLPHPACNLGTSLKQPKSGEIVTEHRWGGKK